MGKVGMHTHWWTDVIEVCRHPLLVASVFLVKWEVGHQLRVRMGKEGWRFEERRWCEIIQENEKMDQGNTV